MYDLDIISLVEKLGDLTRSKDTEWSNMKLLWKTVEQHERIEGINANMDAILSHKLKNALLFDPNYAFYTMYNNGFIAIFKLKDIINVTTMNREFQNITLALEPASPRYFLLIQAHALSKVLVIDDSQEHLEFFYGLVMDAHRSQDKRLMQDSYDYAEAILNR